MKKRLLTKQGLFQLLSTLESIDGNFLTAYVKPACFPDYLYELSIEPKHSIYADEIRDWINTEAIVREINKYSTGIVIFWDENENKHIILPPFPVVENRILTGRPDTSALHKLLDYRYVTGVVLVTWGSYAIGVFDTDKLVSSKTGTGYIHKEHKKGGRSQKRFARRTEEQKKVFLRRVISRIEERFEGFTLEHIFFGGNKLIIKLLLQECKYFQLKTSKISPRILDVRYADREALENSLMQITKSLVLSF